MLVLAVVVAATSMVVGQTPYHEELKAIQPFIGKWKGEMSLEEPLAGVGKAGDKVSVIVDYAWAKNGNGVSIHVSMVFQGKTVDFTDGYLAWDPQKKQIVGVDSYADGGISHYTIAIEGNKLTYTGKGAKGDGTPVSHKIVDILEDKNTLKGQFTNRREGDKQLPDGAVIQLRRVSP